jgi:hypothetical protein
MIAEYLTRRDAELYASELPSSMDQTFTLMSLVCPIRSLVTLFGTCSALARLMARCSRSMRKKANNGTKDATVMENRPPASSCRPWR